MFCKKLQLMHFTKVLKLAVVSLVSFLFFSCQMHDFESSVFDTLDRMIWRNPDSALYILDSLKSCRLSEVENQYCDMMTSYASFRMRPHFVEIDFEKMGKEFEKRRYIVYAGQAYYIQGVMLEWRDETYQAMQKFKMAEHLLMKGDANGEWIGATYYKMGSLSETEQLSDVALEYYSKAIPYLERANLTLFLACAYRDVARNTKELQKREEYFRKALNEAAKLKDNLFYYELKYLVCSLLESSNITEINRLNHILVDSLGLNRYAHSLSEWYIAQSDIDSAEMYLDLFSTDTSLISWSKNKWHYVHSLLLQKEGKNDMAYEEMRNLYDNEVAETKETGKTRTYAIAKRYDLALEQERNMRLVLSQQRSYLIIGLLAVLLVTLGAIVVAQRSRKLATQTKIESLKAELDVKRASLTRILRQRVEVARQMQLEKLRNGSTGKIPEWIQTFLSENLWEHWDGFQEEFNSLYNNLLTNLKTQYPALTSADLQMIALMVLGLSISDICLLLNQTKHTVWSRRLRIKTHLSLTKEDDLDEWVANRIK